MKTYGYQIRWSGIVTAENEDEAFEKVFEDLKKKNQIELEEKDGCGLGCL